TAVWWFRTMRMRSRERCRNFEDRYGVFNVLKAKLISTCIFAVFWVVAFYSLREAFPLFVDGCGPVPGRFWGTSPHMPGFREYTLRQDYYDRLYAIPYVLAALVMAVAARGANYLVRRSRLRRYRLVEAGATLGLVIVIALGSDVGVATKIWNGPLFFLYTDYSVWLLLGLMKIFGPTTLFSLIVSCFAKRVGNAMSAR